MLVKWRPEQSELARLAERVLAVQPERLEDRLGDRPQHALDAKCGSPEVDRVRNSLPC